jgi:hypothetical protein
MRRLFYQLHDDLCVYALAVKHPEPVLAEVSRVANYAASAFRLASLVCTPALTNHSVGLRWTGLVSLFCRIVCVIRALLRMLTGPPLRAADRPLGRCGRLFC